MYVQIKQKLNHFFNLKYATATSYKQSNFKTVSDKDKHIDTIHINARTYARTHTRTYRTAL